MEIIHELEHRVSFGDCDPAGIVFYPNNYAWFDRTFHDWLRKFGGHATLCKKLDALGIGLMEASARFHAPMRDGDTITLALAIERWESKSLHLSYKGCVGDRFTVSGKEVRGLFKPDGAALVAADMEALRNLVDNHDR